MTETQDVLDPRRPRRRTVALVLLGITPLAVAGTAGAAAGQWLPQEAPAVVAEATTTTPPEADVTAAFVAPGDVKKVDPASSVQQIKVTVPEPVETVAPSTPSSSGSTSGDSSSGNSGSTSSSNDSSDGESSGGGSSTETSSSPSFEAYCSSPSAPASAAGGVQALLAAANTERARLGIGALSWSGSLASAAASWSQSMASQDDSTDGTMDALAHNPNRPGAENVAVSYSSGGVSESSASGRAHSGWMYSNGHCLNLMNPAYTQMGAGAATTSDGTTVYTTANYR
ncbi:CAP domain-containing protein [Demequina litorisediminis]|uniref:SCP domain-containing protein n=1 Tax=Demequina litorisediminis TaxID=1849022 RepID=A0ABQ6ID33_9MICO|nr:CAP domain-containing protein [Demequina litorisediminis]GMA35102.1 hypothetical protein GCM10025876_13060 [Demequina litorisediminis]